MEEEAKMEQPMIDEPEWKKREGAAPVVDKAEARKQAMRDRMAKARAARKEAAKKEKVKFEPVSAPAVKVEPEVPIVFFTESDIDPVTKKIKNTYPTYFNRKQREDLEEEIRMMEKGLDEGYFEKSKVGEVRERLKMAKSSLDKIQEHAPVLEKQKDRIYKMTTELGERIALSMPRREDMKKSLVDAHEEAVRMSEPCIELTPQLAGIALSNGMKISKDRKISRDNAVRLWQLGRSALGESRNSEVLRRD